MSQYAGSRYDDDEPRRYHSTRLRPRGPDDNDVVREDIYIERGKNPPRDLVIRERDDSVEDIPRNFPPPGRSDYDVNRRARSAGRRHDDDYYYEDDRYTDHTNRSRRKERQRKYRSGRDYDSDYSDSPPPRERRKSVVGDALESMGLGGVAGAMLGKNKNRSRSRSRDRRSHRSRSRLSKHRRYSSESSYRSRSRGKDPERKWAQAAQAALLAGAVEAIRSRNEPGPWTGEKGKRIATAALGAGGIDGLLDKNPEAKTKRHLAQAVVGGVAASRLANGPRSKSRGRDRAYSPDGVPGRSRSIIDRFRGRSKSRGRRSSSFSPPEKDDRGGAVKGVVAGGALAAAGKAIYDRVRSKSRRRRSPSSSSADSYVPSRNRRRDRRRSPPSDTDDRAYRSRAVTDRGPGRDTNGGGRAAAAAAGAGDGALAAGGRRDENRGTRGEAMAKGDGNHSTSDSSSTTDMQARRKQMRGKELLTAGLATIATIHAAHGVYSSMEAHEKRHKLVAEHEMTPEEARKKQTKAWVQDAAAIGIAALGIKGAFSEWKEMNQQREEIHEIEKRRRERRRKLQHRQRREAREQQERMLQIMSASANPAAALVPMSNMQGGNMPMPAMPNMPNMPTPGYGGYGYQTYMPPENNGRPPPDQSGNPYAPR